MKRILLLLVALLPLTLGAKEPAKTDTIYLHGFDTETAKHFTFNFSLAHSLNYLCRFSPEDNPQFALPAYNDSLWVRCAPLFSSEALRDSLSGGVGWFRFRIQADSAVVNQPVAFSFKGSGAMIIYLDGRQVGKIGTFKNEGQPRYVSLASAPVLISVPVSGIHVLAIRYENTAARQYEDIAWGFSLEPFHPDFLLLTLKHNLLVASVGLVGIGTLFFTLFLVHLLLFLFYRKEISNLYFALFNISVSLLLFLLYYGYVSERVFLHSYGNAAIMVLCCIAGCFSLSAFTVQLFSKGKLFLRIILAVSIVVAVISVIDIYCNTNFSSLGMTVLVLLSLGYTIIRILIAIFTRMPGALILGAGVLFFLCVFLFVFVWSIFGGGIHLSGYVLLLVILSIFAIPLSISSYLAWRFSSTSKDLTQQLVTVEHLSREKQSILENQKEELEKEVVARTHEVVRQKKEIELEKKKSDELLLNILPAEIAEELKRKGESKAQLYDEATVLFTDFVNFTRISEQLGVEELLEELNINFTAFDRIMEKYGLEKIKTIGDAYLAVSGLPVAHPRHAQQAVFAALDILDFVAARQKQVPYGLDIRIGINSGALIAGIIGVKKFAYDIWGDTVNTAARMEQSSAAGRINISENTYQLIKGEFVCTHRGKIDAKHKGEMDMYFVEKSINSRVPAP
ncbi:adenylate/guanylate cyclase domain-containing protein [Taibaiella koreensis]|uniref:adenylate/guanylate cyclase domain-containing protein n=1 Tax=Taibaiella koreensis TaxID=1268548 RepID=UPI000E5A03B4|nr:adenylate/guanylate cyclase domain-containing protein [Taibaiella koreensis]